MLTGRERGTLWRVWNPNIFSNSTSERKLLPEKIGQDGKANKSPISLVKNRSFHLRQLKQAQNAFLTANVSKQ